MNLAAFVLGTCVGLIVAGLLYQRIGAWRDRRHFTNSGRWVEANGCAFYVVEKGQGGPTVVFESGIAASHLNWHCIQNAVSGFARTVSYDRPGLGWSNACATARTPSNIAAELHQLLQRAGVNPPYVLVGHSFGGFVMRRFALTYPYDVSSVVLVDPMRCDEWPPVNQAAQTTVNRAVRLCGFAIPIAQLGIARLAVTSLLCRSGRASRWLTRAGGDGAKHVMGRVRQEIGKMPREAWPIVAAHWSRPDFYAGVRAYVGAVPGAVHEMLAADPIRSIPVVVLTPDSSTPLSVEALSQIADNIRQVTVPDSAHWVHLDQPQAVIEIIRCAVESAATKAAQPVL
jgi:pimeloyl-ACP methyl ester carboxylesterase